MAKTTNTVLLRHCNALVGVRHSKEIIRQIQKLYAQQCLLPQYRLVENQKHLKWQTIGTHINSKEDYAVIKKIIMKSMQKNGGRGSYNKSGKGRKQCCVLPVMTRGKNVHTQTRLWGDYAKIEIAALLGDGIWMIFVPKFLVIMLYSFYCQQ